MSYRKLKANEIMQLIHNGCIADDWNNLSVAEEFDPKFVKKSTFSGKIILGDFKNEFELDGGVKIHSGIFNAKVHNCIIGNDTYIGNISNYIANYNIGSGAFIENVNRIVTCGTSAFGNGIKVSVLNETGGRDVTIYDKLSAHLAYMIAMYRYRPRLIEKLEALISHYASIHSSSIGSIGKNAKITNVNLIQDVRVGEKAQICGASKLKNGTIAGSENDPVYVGDNVIAEDFIFCSGTIIDDGAILNHSFVGQGTKITHLFSAHDSLFFANCACENGEAAAIFAGPYTVSMHKSSLLIAGMFSFLNAGSGSNQSNHMYKLGPIHQGIVERGSKTTSDSYILWPAKIGAFSLVMGRHISHPDTSMMPFSYLIENKGKSYLVPGVNLKSVGTIRDAQKWPKRDRRKDSYKLDYVNFNLLSPYTVGKMGEAIKILNTLEATSGLTADRYTYQSMTIEPRALRKGRKYYEMAIDKFMGNSLIKKLENVTFSKDTDFHSFLLPVNVVGKGEWVDMSGLIMPKNELLQMVDSIETNGIKTLEEIEHFFKKMNRDYYDMEWTWVVEHFMDWYGKEVCDLSPEDIIAIVKRWKESVLGIDELLYDDSCKEFSMVAKTGFGIDGSIDRKDSDFEQVRGAFEECPFVNMVNEHMKKKTELGEELIQRVEKLM